MHLHLELMLPWNPRSARQQRHRVKGPGYGQKAHSVACDAAKPRNSAGAASAPGAACSCGWPRGGSGLRSGVLMHTAPAAAQQARSPAHAHAGRRASAGRASGESWADLGGLGWPMGGPLGLNELLSAVWGAAHKGASLVRGPVRLVLSHPKSGQLRKWATRANFRSRPATGLLQPRGT